MSELYSPVSGVVSAVNQLLSDAPETVNSDPYGDGWIFEVEVTSEEELDDLMDSDAYAEHVGQ